MRNIRNAFDSIRAEDELKTNTAAYLRSEIKNRQGLRVRARKRALAIASFVIVFLAGAFSHNLYFTTQTYLDMDVNPAVAISVNRFDRVIDVYAYNPDGEELLSGLGLSHKDFREAVRILMNEMAERGYLRDGGLVSVTLQTDDAGREKELLVNIETGIADMISGHHISAQVDVFPVSVETRNAACGFNVSPAKYLAIRSLQEVDPTVEMESCSGHSISEIKRMTHAHNGMRGKGEGEAPQDSQDTQEADEPDTGHSGGHNGNGHGGGHQ